jgi:hypothetical protein
VSSPLPPLVAGGLIIPVANSTHGLFLDVDSDGWLAPLAWLSSQWIQAQLTELLPCIERGDDFRGGGVSATRPAEARPELRALWRERTGGEVGDDAVIVHADAVPQSLLLPRHALVAILRDLERRRRDAPPFEWKPPPATLFSMPPSGAAGVAGVVRAYPLRESAGDAATPRRDFLEDPQSLVPPALAS